MSANILSQLNSIIDELVEDEEFVCAAHLQMVVDRLAERTEHKAA